MSVFFCVRGFATSAYRIARVFTQNRLFAGGRKRSNAHIVPIHTLEEKMRLVKSVLVAAALATAAAPGFAQAARYYGGHHGYRGVGLGLAIGLPLLAASTYYAPRYYAPAYYPPAYYPPAYPPASYYAPAYPPAPYYPPAAYAPGYGYAPGYVAPRPY
jgi:hypothetical protein